MQKKAKDAAYGKIEFEGSTVWYNFKYDKIAISGVATDWRLFYWETKGNKTIIGVDPRLVEFYGWIYIGEL